MVHSLPSREEAAPAALVGRPPVVAALQHRAPVGGDVVDVHADLADHVRRHVADRLELRVVGGDQHHHFLAGVAGLLQHLLDLARSRADPSAAPARQSLAIGVLGQKKPCGVWYIDGSLPTIASMNDGWSMA